MAESSTHLFSSRSGSQCHWVKAKVSAKLVPGGRSREGSTSWPFPASGSHLLSRPPDPFLELPRFLASMITSLTTSPGSDLPLPPSYKHSWDYIWDLPSKTRIISASQEPSCIHVPGTIPGSRHEAVAIFGG